MDKLNNKLIADLLLTKAMSDNVGRIERWASLDDVVDELLMDDAIDREEYLTSIMKLTQLGLIASDIESEEDIEMSEAVGFEIAGVTKEGLAYIDSLYADTTVKDKVTEFFNRFSEVCGAISDNGAVRLLGTTIVPILSLFV